MNKAILTDIIISNLTKETVKKLTYKLGKVINVKAKTPLSHSDVCEVVAQLLEFESWNHLTAELKADKTEKDVKQIKLQFVNDFLSHINDDETYFVDDDFDSTYPNTYVLFGVGAECNFEDESEAKLEMFDELMEYYADLTYISKQSVSEYAVSGELSGKACADAFNAEIVETAIPSAIWEKEDEKLLQQFKKLSDSELKQITSNVAEHGLFYAVNAFFDGDLSCVALTLDSDIPNVDGTVESKAFNYIENKVIH